MRTETGLRNSRLLAQELRRGQSGPIVCVITAGATTGPFLRGRERHLADFVAMSATRGVETGLEGNDIIYPLNFRLRTEVCARTVMKATRCIDIFESVMGCGSERCYAACRDSTQRIRATQLIADVSWHRCRRVSKFFENVLCPLSDTYSRLRPALSVSLSRSNELGRDEGRMYFWSAPTSLRLVWVWVCV